MHFTGTKCSLWILLFDEAQNVKIAWRFQAANTTVTCHKVGTGGKLRIQSRASDKTLLNIANESQKVIPFPAGGYKAALKRQDNMTNAKHK